MTATGITKVVIELDTGQQLVFGKEAVKHWSIDISQGWTSSVIDCKVEVEQRTTFTLAEGLRRLMSQKGES